MSTKCGRLLQFFNISHRKSMTRMVSAAAPMVKLKAVASKVVQRGSCEKVLELAIIYHDRKAKYEVALKSNVFDCLEPKNR